MFLPFSRRVEVVVGCLWVLPWFFQWYLSVSHMEEVESMWKKLSLSEEEEFGLEVPKLSGVPRLLLARKFLMHRMINKEAGIRTFKPLW